MNIHDETLEFEPIQRVIFETEPKKLLDELVAFYGAEYEDNGGQRIDYTYGGNEAVSILRIQTQIFLSEHFKNFLISTLSKMAVKLIISTETTL